MVMDIIISAPDAGKIQKKFLKKATTFSKGENPKRVMQAAFLVERDAKIGCPVDTGRLRASIRSQKLNNESAKVFTDVEYAPYVEFPTARKHYGAYFMTNALNNNRIKIVAIMGAGVKVAVKR